jgi:mevalonate kinase
MASENAKAVAREVAKNLRNSKKVDLGKILREKGYSQSVSEAPQNVTQTKSYQEAIEPFLDKMIKERDRILDAMEQKDLTKVQYQHLAEVADKFTKNIQLLGGRPTENNKLEIEWLKS